MSEPYTRGTGPARLTQLSKADPKAYYPTGLCFDNAMDFLGELMLAKIPTQSWEQWIKPKNWLCLNDYRLVHAFCTWSDGEPYAHAWVEQFGTHVYEGKLLAGQTVFIVYPRDVFYRDMAVVDPTHYTPREAMLLNAKTNYFGPWEKKYLTALASKMDDFILGETQNSATQG